MTNSCVQSLVVLVAVVVSSGAQAQEFRTDLSNTRVAVDFSNGDQSALERIADVKAGQQQTMLPEASAPWAGNYFPMESGGIANRWQTGGYPQQTLDQTKTLAELKALTPAEIASLSPIEKYDLFVGDYSFKATKWEINNRGPLRRPPPENWEGFCNGARCAGGLLPEPLLPVTVESRDGLKVTFEPADLKALGSASYFYVEKYAALGSPATRDLKDRPNAGAFDLALRYFIGELKRPFIIDAHLGTEIWNESVVGYNRTIKSETPVTPQEATQFRGAVAKVEVDLVLNVLGEVSIRASNARTKAAVSSGAVTETMKMQYTLFVDANNRVIDGKWSDVAGTHGVDFVWFGAGKGADANPSIGDGNRALRFSVIDRLFQRAGKMTCEAMF
jgi:Transglutaminase elicitor